MRIIERVKLPETEVRCPNCQSLLAYDKNDVVYKQEEFFGDWHDSKSVKCPVCQRWIIVEVDGEKIL